MTTYLKCHNGYIKRGIMQTANVGIREAKMNLSKYLKKVQKGTELIITDRGRPIGKIVPIQNEDLSLEDRIKIMVDRGVIEKISSKRLNKIPPPIPVSDNIAQKFLREDRDSNE